MRPFISVRAKQHKHHHKSHLGHLQAGKSDFLSTSSSEYSEILGFSLSACRCCIKF